MAGARVLIIHGRQRTRQRLERYLSTAREDYAISTLADGVHALPRIQALRPHVVVSGCRFNGDAACWDLCRSIRRHHPSHELGILAVVSCLEDGHESMALLEGADLCLHAERLTNEVVRLNVASLAERVACGRDRPLRIGGLTLVPQGRWVRLGGRKLQLTPTQFSILWMMAQRPGQLIPAEDLLGHQEGVSREKAVELAHMHIHRLRSRLGPDRTLIRCVRHEGYGLDLEWRVA